jgi:hypothetical protein
MFIQRAWRDYKNTPVGPTDEEIEYCIIRVQSRWRGKQSRIQYQMYLAAREQEERECK